MDREWCLEHDNDFREIEYKGIIVWVSPTGRVKTYNSKNKTVAEKSWHYDVCGYPHISLYGHKNPSVHRLVALAWVENPEELPEVNHKDFDRNNPCAHNLEWITHHENVLYSRRAGRYPDQSGENNSNYGNRKLSKIYAQNKDLAKEKQSRPLGQNGRAIRCNLFAVIDGKEELINAFDTQLEAAYWLCENHKLPRDKYGEKSYCGVVDKLKKGWRGYILRPVTNDTL